MSVEYKESGKSDARQLLLEDKVEILKQLDNGVSVNSLCEKYSISPSTIQEIKKQKNDILQFGEYKTGSKHDEIMMLWYQYYKEKYGLPTSWMVKEQAFGFHQELKLKTPCRYGEQWLKAFKQEHGIALKDEEQTANKVSTAKNVNNNDGVVNESQNCSDEKIKRKHSSPPMARKSVLPHGLENGVSTQQLSKKCKTTHSAIHDSQKLQNVKLKNDAEIKSQNLEGKKEHTYQLKLRAFDRALLAWIRDQTKNGGFLNSQSIIKQAKIYHKELRLDSACEYTEKWMHEFMKQNRVQYVTVRGNKLPISEAASGSTVARGEFHLLL